MKTIFRTILGTALAMLFVGNVSAAPNPFSVPATGNTEVAAMEGGKCGAGKCGASMNMKKSDMSDKNGKCGTGMKQADKPMKDGKCGTGMKQTDKPMKDGKCGTGMKQTDKPMKGGKCGAGKCGAGMK